MGLNFLFYAFFKGFFKLSIDFNVKYFKLDLKHDFIDKFKRKVTYVSMGRSSTTSSGIVVHESVINRLSEIN